MCFFAFFLFHFDSCVIFAVADDLQPVLFDESLLTFSDSGDEVGKFNVLICSTEDECIEVKSSSTAVIDGVSCGNVISARLSRIGQTLEQNHFEYVKVCKIFTTISDAVQFYLIHEFLHRF